MTFRPTPIIEEKDDDPYGLKGVTYGTFEEPNEEDIAEIDDLGLEFNYDKWKNSDKLKNASIRFAKNHLGYDEINADDAVNETIEHFRKFSVNELTAARDYNYVSALVADKKQNELTTNLNNLTTNLNSLTQTTDNIDKTKSNKFREIVETRKKNIKTHKDIVESIIKTEELLKKNTETLQNIEPIKMEIDNFMSELKSPPPRAPHRRKLRWN